MPYRCPSGSKVHWNCRLVAGKWLNIRWDNQRLPLIIILHMLQATKNKCKYLYKRNWCENWLWCIIWDEKLVLLCFVYDYLKKMRYWCHSYVCFCILWIILVRDGFRKFSMGAGGKKWNFSYKVLELIIFSKVLRRRCPLP